MSSTKKNNMSLAAAIDDHPKAFRGIRANPIDGPKAFRRTNTCAIFCIKKMIFLIKNHDNNCDCPL